MVTGQAPFRGPSAEVMYQHQHAPLPLERLRDVPQPVVVLLEKDPARRFQSPIELLKAMPTVTDAIDRRRRITRQSLRKMPSTASRVGTRKPPARPAPKKISVARLPVTGSDVFGREEDIAFLDRAFAAKVLGARGALLSALIHFFENGRWGLPEEMDVEGHALTAEDQLFILMQAGLYLTATRGFAAPEALSCYERAESLCVSLNQPLVLFSALRGLWRHSLISDKLSATMRIAKRVYSLAQ